MDIVSFKKPDANAPTDEELVLTARTDTSGGAMQELLRRISPFIISKANSFGQTEQDRQDYYQEGIVGFLSAVHAYKHDSGTRFSTFACTCILNRMKNLLRQRSKGSEYQLLSLEQTQSTQDFQAGPEDEIQAAYDAENIIKAISQKLSPYEKQVLRMYLQGESYTAVAEKTGKTAKSVDNAMQRIRRKLKSEADS
ncbi:MAG: sigma-70 family RNA polymerase sigma factor [Clostridia bacterium]|nr:sigma-70 family RNA polymerase sigma factor [Clostridia bacterium]